MNVKILCGNKISYLYSVLQESEEGVAIPVSQRATAFAVGSQSVWLGTAHGYLLICKIIKLGQAVEALSEDDGPECQGDEIAGCHEYSLKLVGLHRVSEDALRVVLVST